MQKTLINLALHEIFDAEGRQLATGTIIDPEKSAFRTLSAWVNLHAASNASGQRLVTININPDDPGFLPLHAWGTFVPDPATTPRKGRKKNLAKKAAVLLAHRWHRSFKGMNHEEADEALLPLFGYKDIRAVRRVRQEADKQLEGRYELHSSSDNQGCSHLFEATATLRFEDERFEIAGPGWRWFSGDLEAEYGRWQMKGEGGRAAIQFMRRALGGQEERPNSCPGQE